MIGCSLVSTDDKVLCSDEGIKLGSTDGKVLGNILVNVYGITLGLDVATELGFLEEFFDYFNDGNIEALFLGSSLGSSDGKVLGSDEVIKLGFLNGKLIGTILLNVYLITLGFDIGTDLGSVYLSFDGSNGGNP